MCGHNNAAMCASTEGPGSLFQSRQPILEIRTRKGPNFSWHSDPTGTLNAQNRDPKIRVINQLFQLYIFDTVQASQIMAGDKMMSAHAF